VPPQHPFARRRAIPITEVPIRTKDPTFGPVERTDATRRC
jgi:hypothetical protein